jgi:DnaJ-class molecular chaperone
MEKESLRGLPVGIDCPKCDGEGADENGDTCEWCDGTGAVDSYLNGIEYANGKIEK